MIENAGVDPHPFRSIPGPSRLDRLSQEVASKALANESGRQTEIGDLYVAAVLS